MKMSKIPLPVIIENLIQNVTDQSKHPEKRQHYAKTLKDIIDQSSVAYRQWEKDFDNRK